MAWKNVCPLEAIAPLGARVVEHPDGPIALIRAQGNAVFAIEDRCPHKGGPLSQGIVHGHRVTCPLHNLNLDLETGRACEPEEGCVRRFGTRVEDGQVWLDI